MNRKSDVPAKSEFIKELAARGFKAEVTNAPADITATKDDKTWYFEIKMTHHSDKYFGAATSTEWKQAFADPEHYRFVVAIANEDDTEFEFHEYTPAEFMAFSTIPPFKVYFNIDFTGKKKAADPSKETKSKPLTKSGFDALLKAYESLPTKRG